MSWTSFFSKDIWKEDYWFKVNAYYAQNYSVFDMPFHRHEEVEIMYVMKGNGTVIAANNIDPNNLSSALKVEKVIELKAGYIVLLDTGVWHKLIINDDEPCHIYNLEFIFKKQEKYSIFTLRELLKLSKGMANFLKERPRFQVLADDNDYISKVFPMLIHELTISDCGDGNIVDTLLQLLFNYVTRIYTYNSQKTQYIPHVQKAIYYIHEKFDDDIKIADIADYVYLNSSYLQRIFKKWMGESILSYVTNLRIEKARMLLENTKFPIIDIAISVGFNNRQNFALVFQKYFNVSASQYRNNYLKTQNNLVYVGHDSAERKKNIITRDNWM